MSFIKDLLLIFYPKICANCQNILLQNEEVICVFCRHDLPLTNFTDYTNNKITQTFYGRVTIEKATSLLFFRKKGITKNLIHELKYKDNEDVGVFFGNWFGEILKENKEFTEVNYIVPVPLHPRKLRKRGYNQLTKFGQTLSHHLQVPFLEDNLLKISSSKTQTLKARFERFNTIDTQFQLSDCSVFVNKHVLLIDDIITTGATLEACVKEIQKSRGVKVSILTMAYTQLI